VLVDPQDTGTVGVLALADLPIQEILLPALDGGASHPLSTGEGLLGNPFVVVGEDLAAEGFGRPAIAQDSGEALAEVSPAPQATKLPTFEQQIAGPQSEARVPKPADVPVLPSQLPSTTKRAGHGPDVSDREHHRLNSVRSLDLKSRQSEYTGIVGHRHPPNR